jgi:hypothetical protein
MLFYAAVLPLVAPSRVAERLKGHDEVHSQMRKLGAILNATFWLTSRLELPLLRGNRLAGLTVFVRGVK